MYCRSLFLLFLVLAASACQGDPEQDRVNLKVDAPSTPVSEPAFVDTTLTEQTSIKKIDFRNFTYTGPEDYSDTFTLKNGEKTYVSGKEDGISLGKIIYKDLTGDGKEEAIVRMGIETGGTALPSLVFVFTLEDKKLETLWKFMSGDRVEGGLRDVQADDGLLIVELFGENEFVNGKWESRIPEGKFKGMCCPRVYTRTKFKWDGKQFVVEGTREMFDLPEKAKGAN